VRLQTDVSGIVRGIETAQALKPGDQHLGRLLLPAIPNAHSHVFQRLIAGRTEFQSNPTDDFWSWREAMYACANRLSPADLYVIARHTYREMQLAGYGQVSEFHYVHLDPSGQLYGDPAAMSKALIAAAAEVGIGLTLLPTLYLRGGFDDQPLSARQRRFGLALDHYINMISDLRSLEHARLRIGIALHSLRAVSPSALAELLNSEVARTGPIHIHIAEQQAEVQQCMAVLGRRPIDWLFDHVEIDARWNLVHATHADTAEIQRIAASGAGVVLCPSTEANLGDGLFALPEFLDAGGTLAIGSDSHIELDPIEELKLAEYGQRLRLQARNRCASSTQTSVAARLLDAVLRGGQQAADLACGELRVGGSADFIACQPAPGFEMDNAERLLDTWVFARPRGLQQAFCAGQRVAPLAGDAFAALRCALTQTQD
jgi:formimidoylglutamate deiminase